MMVDAKRKFAIKEQKDPQAMENHMNHLGYSRYDEPINAYSEGVERDEEFLHVEKIHEMKEKMKLILAIVYGDTDLEDLEYELEVLASHFELKLPPRAFRLART